MLSCAEVPSGETVTNKIEYFKDSRTGLCFAMYSNMVYGGFATSITCVPCDSLIKIGIK